MQPQDLHIHTRWSSGDSAIVPEQTVELIASVRHALVIGISDHLEHVCDRFDAYSSQVRAAGLKLGMEVNGHQWVDAALDLDCDYRIFHCFDRDADYQALDRLLASGRPLVIAHPNALDTQLGRVPPECLVEINNRYIWRCDWQRFYGPFVSRFRFVLGSDAHQPNWLNLTLARHAARQLGIAEHLVFPDG
jgi:histidinol phosphatase-like PHP family hydrolase